MKLLALVFFFFYFGITIGECCLQKEAWSNGQAVEYSSCLGNIVLGRFLRMSVRHENRIRSLCLESLEILIVRRGC